MSAATKYAIIVTKDATGKFNIVDKVPDSNTYTKDTRAPTQIITDPTTSDVFFYVEVIQGTGANSFDVGGVNYKLNLDNAFTDFNKYKVIDQSEFNNMHKTFTSSTSSATPTPTPTNSAAAPTPTPTISSTLSEYIKSSNNVTAFLQKVSDNETALKKFDDQFEINDVISIDNNNTPISGSYAVTETDLGDSFENDNNGELYKYELVAINNNLRLYRWDKSQLYGGKSKRRSKRNYSKKQRKHYSKNDTLRNYL